MALSPPRRSEMGAFYLVFGPMELSAGLGYTTIPPGHWDGLRTPRWLRVRALPDTHRCTVSILPRWHFSVCAGVEIEVSLRNPARGRICPVAQRNSDKGMETHSQSKTCCSGVMIMP